MEQKKLLTVREATWDDLARINEIRRQVNELHVSGRPDTFRPGFCQELQDRASLFLEDTNRKMIAAVIGDTVCGFAAIEYLERPENAFNLARKMYHVEEIGVDRAFQGMGAGRAMIGWMKADAAERGFPRIELDMWEFNENALAFYEAVGFQTYRRYMELYV